MHTCSSTTNRINSELSKIGRILTLFLMTEISCSDRIMLSLKLKLKIVPIDIFVYLELVIAKFWVPFERSRLDLAAWA